MPGYEKDEIGIDLPVDPVLMDQPSCDLAERQFMPFGKRPPPARHEQGLEVVSDGYPCSVLF